VPSGEQDVTRLSIHSEDAAASAPLAYAGSRTPSATIDGNDLTRKREGVRFKIAQVTAEEKLA